MQSSGETKHSSCSRVSTKTDSLFVFLPLLPDGEIVEVTKEDVVSQGLQTEQDITQFALQKSRCF